MMDVFANFLARQFGGVFHTTKTSIASEHLDKQLWFVSDFQGCVNNCVQIFRQALAAEARSLREYCGVARFDSWIQEPSFSYRVPIGAKVFTDISKFVDERYLCRKVAICHVLDRLGFQCSALKVFLCWAEYWKKPVDEPTTYRELAAENYEWNGLYSVCPEGMVVATLA